MKIKHQLAIFNVLTRLSLILILVFFLPVLVKQVIYKHIDKTLLEKKQKFIEHLNDKEIDEFVNKSDSSDTYASFSRLHGEFILLSKLGEKSVVISTKFVDEPRIIEEQQEDYRILQYRFVYKNMSYELEVGSGLSEIKDLTFTIRLFTIILLLIVVVITFLLDTFFVDYLLTPFYKIINTKIKRVDQPNSFNYTPIKSHSSDFQELDSVLNQMMLRIDDLFQKEKQFIGNVSHELLTPISLLKNRFENLLQNESIDDEGIDKIASSLKTLDLLKKIINNLLLISRIENNQFENNEQVSVVETINAILEDFDDRIQEKQIEIVTKIKEDFVFTGNKTLLRIMISNLILNAIKYNKIKGKIIVASSFDENYTFTISDTGLGMSAYKLNTIFERFTRIDNTTEGQGLGLAIVDSIAKFHHITIAVESELDFGSTFIIRFS